MVGDKEHPVTQSQCQRLHVDVSMQLSTQNAALAGVNEKIVDLDAKVAENKEEITDLYDDIYGRVEHGEQKGGLVILVRDINKKLDNITDDLATIKKNGKTGLSKRDKATITVAMIGGIFGLLATIVNAVGGR